MAASGYLHSWHESRCRVDLNYPAETATPMRNLPETIARSEPLGPSLSGMKVDSRPRRMRDRPANAFGGRDAGVRTREQAVARAERGLRQLSTRWS
jgi:hypothetical protein